MSSTVVFSDPAGLHAPAGSYRHAATLAAGTRVLLISGQVGIRPDGSLGTTVLEQADQVFMNLRAVLQAHHMTFADIVKLSTYVVAGQPGADVGVARKKYFGEHRPTATFIYVPQLFKPEWLVEVEAIAARG